MSESINERVNPLGDRNDEIAEKVQAAMKEKEKKDAIARREGEPIIGARKVLRISDIIPKTGYIRVPLRQMEDLPDNTDLSPDALGYALFRQCDAKTLQKYRETFSPMNAKRTYPDEANAYMIEEKFVGFQDFDCEYGTSSEFDDNVYSSEKEWFAMSPDGRYIADFVIGTYLKKATPNTQDVKK